MVDKIELLLATKVKVWLSLPSLNWTKSRQLCVMTFKWKKSTGNVQYPMDGIVINIVCHILFIDLIQTAFSTIFHGPSNRWQYYLMKIMLHVLICMPQNWWNIWKIIAKQQLLGHHHLTATQFFFLIEADLDADSDIYTLFLCELHCFVTV